MPDLMYEANMLGTWTDITADVRTAAATDITRGLASWAPTADPSKAVFRLNNRHGRYSRHNPLSPYYRQLSRYTKLRVSVPSPVSLLEIYDTTGTVTTPHSDAVEMSGDLDVRVEIDAFLQDSASNQAIFGKWDDSDPAEQQWMLRIFTEFAVFQFRDAAGVERFAFCYLSAFGGKILRATYDVDNGTGNYAVRWYQADDWDNPSWLEISVELVGSGVVGLQATTSSPLRIGITDVSSTPDRLPWIGYGYRFQLRRGIKGLIVADADFGPVPGGATSFADTRGNTWTVSGGARVVDRSYRFHGEVNEWPSTSDVSDTDSYVTVTAQSRMRRDAIGDPLKSILSRRVPGYRPRAYWPCEDGENSSRIYSPVGGVSPMSVANMAFAQDSSMPASDPLPTVATQSGAVVSRMSGPVRSGGSTTGWSVYFLYRLNSQPSSYASYMCVQGTGTVKDWRLQLSNAGSRILGLNADGTAVVSHLIGTGSDLFNQWILVRFYAQQSGGNVNWGISWTDIGGTAGSFDDSYAGTLGRVSSVGSPPDGWNQLVDGLALGHISVWDAVSTGAYAAASTGDPLIGYAGEYLTDRLHRLAFENQIPITYRAKRQSGERVGAQPKASFLDIVQDAAKADGGILLDQRNRASYLYLAPSWLTNRAPAIVLDYNQPGHVVGEFRPLEDGQYVENDATVSRSGGSSGRYEKTVGSLNVGDPESDEDGIGRVAKQTTLNLFADEKTESLAAWRVHLGTWDQPRFPRLTVDARAILATVPGIASIDVGDVIKVTGIPERYSYGDVYLLVLGYSERLTQFEWQITFNCVPYGSWDTAISGVSRVQASEHSTLAAAATSTATTLSVRSEAALWATSAAFPGDFPFDVLVDGERMTVTAVSGTSSPQTFTVVRSINGVVKAQPEDARVTVFAPSHVALSE